MRKTSIIVAILFPIAASAAATVSTQQGDHGQSGNVVGTRGAQVFDLLSMGPDPGGKTGATVTPTTTKTGQPSADGAGGANQAGAGSASGSGAASNKPDPSAGPSDSSKQPSSTTPTAPTSPSGKPR